MSRATAEEENIAINSADLIKNYVNYSLKAFKFIIYIMFSDDQYEPMIQVVNLRCSI